MVFPFELDDWEPCWRRSSFSLSPRSPRICDEMLCWNSLCSHRKWVRHFWACVSLSNQTPAAVGGTILRPETDTLKLGGPGRFNCLHLIQMKGVLLAVGVTEYSLRIEWEELHYSISSSVLFCAVCVCVSMCVCVCVSVCVSSSLLS